MKEPETMATTTVNPPGFTGVGHPEAFTTMPPQPTEKKPGQLPLEKVKEYFENGFVVAEGVFTPEEMEYYMQGFVQIVEELAQKLYKAGKITNMHADRTLKDRLIMLDKEWPGAIRLLLKQGKLPKVFQELYQNEKLLNILEQLLGPEIATNPVWNTRPKCPSHEGTHVPWHQDSCYFDEDSYDALIATAWIAFVDADEQNGCLQFARGGQRKGLVAMHEGCTDLYLTVSEEEMAKRLGVDPEKDFILAPVKAGGVVFFSNMIPHRSVPNKSDHTRWAVDFRYQSPRKPFGFFGLKKGILIRSPDQPNLVPDWDYFNNQDRYVLQKKYEIEKKHEGEVDPFDVLFSGPYFDRWNITHPTVHSEHYFKKKAELEAQEEATKAK